MAGGGRLRSLAGDTAIYGLSSILGRMLNYLLVPLYTAKFAPEQYGVVTELYAVAAFLNVLYLFGLETAYFRFATREPGKEGAYFQQATTAVVLLSVLFSGSMVLLASPLVEALGYPGQEIYIYWFAGILAVDALVAIPFAKLRLEKRAKRFAVAKLINIGLNVGLNLFFIVLCADTYGDSYGVAGWL